MTNDATDEPDSRAQSQGTPGRGTSPDACLLYTSDAADDMQCVDLGGRRTIKKTKQENQLTPLQTIPTNMRSQ